MKLLGRRRHRGEENLKVYTKEIGRENKELSKP